MSRRNTKFNYADLRITKRLRPAIPWKLRDKTTRQNIPESHFKMFGGAPDHRIGPNLFSGHHDPTRLKFLVVFDLDETLIYADLERKIIRTARTYFLRPYAKLCLQLCANEPRCYCVLWSKGDDIHVYDALAKTNIGHYFDLVLTRKDCQKSFEEFGYYKSYQHLVKLLRLPSNISSFLIDDIAIENAGVNQSLNYTEIRKIAPFTLERLTKILTGKGRDNTLFKEYTMLNKLMVLT